MKLKTKLVNHFKNRSLSENITKIIFFCIFTFMCLVFLYPIIFCLICSFRTLVENIKGVSSLFPFPKEINLKGWENLFTEFVVQSYNGVITDFAGMLVNSLWFTAAKVLLSLLASTLLAYACAKYRFPGRGLIYATVIFVQTIPIFGSTAASLKLFQAFGMINRPWFFWVAWLTGFDMSFIIMYGAFKNMSDAYSESAKIDGASDLTVLLKIIFPMAVPILLALIVTNSLSVWNEYSTMQIYLNDYPNLAFGLYKFGLENNTRDPSYYAAMIMTMVPIAVLYAASQKLVLKNVSVGGLKG